MLQRQESPRYDAFLGKTLRTTTPPALHVWKWKVFGHIMKLHLVFTAARYAPSFHRESLYIRSALKVNKTFEQFLQKPTKLVAFVLKPVCSWLLRSLHLRVCVLWSRIQPDVSFWATETDSSWHSVIFHQRISQLHSTPTFITILFFLHRGINRCFLRLILFPQERFFYVAGSV